MRREAAKVEALFAEIPFLESHFDKGRISLVKVQRIGPDFPGKVPVEAVWQWGWTDMRVKSQLVLLNKNGRKLIRVGFREISGRPKSRWFFLRKSFWQGDFCSPDPYPYYAGESVADALSRLGPAANDVFFATELETVDPDSRVYRLTFYKPPKGFSLTRWVEEQERRAHGEIQEEVAQIDAEAATT